MLSFKASNLRWFILLSVILFICLIWLVFKELSFYYSMVCLLIYSWLIYICQLSFWNFKNISMPNGWFVKKCTENYVYMKKKWMPLLKSYHLIRVSSPCIGHPCTLTHNCNIIIFEIFARCILNELKWIVYQYLMQS